MRSDLPGLYTEGEKRQPEGKLGGSYHCKGAGEGVVKSRSLRRHVPQTCRSDVTVREGPLHAFIGPCFPCALACPSQ